MKIFRTKRSFKKEFRRQLKLAIIAAIGFTVAFAWRNAVYHSTQSLVEKFTEQTHAVLNEVFTALTITIIAVILILILSKIMKDR